MRLLRYFRRSSRSTNNDNDSSNSSSSSSSSSDDNDSSSSLEEDQQTLKRPYRQLLDDSDSQEEHTKSDYESANLETFGSGSLVEVLQARCRQQPVYTHQEAALVSDMESLAASSIQHHDDSMESSASSFYSSRDHLLFQDLSLEEHSSALRQTGTTPLCYLATATAMEQEESSDDSLSGQLFLLTGQRNSDDGPVVANKIKASPQKTALLRPKESMEVDTLVLQGSSTQTITEIEQPTAVEESVPHDVHTLDTLAQQDETIDEEEATVTLLPSSFQQLHDADKAAYCSGDFTSQQLRFPVASALQGTQGISFKPLDKTVRCCDKTVSQQLSWQIDPVMEDSALQVVQRSSLAHGSYEERLEEAATDTMQVTTHSQTSTSSTDVEKHAPATAEGIISHREEHDSGCTVVAFETTVNEVEKATERSFHVVNEDEPITIQQHDATIPCCDENDGTTNDTVYPQYAETATVNAQRSSSAPCWYEEHLDEAATDTIEDTTHSQTSTSCIDDEKRAPATVEESMPYREEQESCCTVVVFEATGNDVEEVAKRSLHIMSHDEPSANEQYDMSIPCSSSSAENDGTANDTVLSQYAEAHTLDSLSLPLPQHAGAETLTSMVLSGSLDNSEALAVLTIQKGDDKASEPSSNQMAIQSPLDDEGLVAISSSQEVYEGDGNSSVQQTSSIHCEEETVGEPVIDSTVPAFVSGIATNQMAPGSTTSISEGINKEVMGLESPSSPWTSVNSTFYEETRERREPFLASIDVVVPDPTTDQMAVVSNGPLDDESLAANSSIEESYKRNKVLNSSEQLISPVTSDETETCVEKDEEEVSQCSTATVVSDSSTNQRVPDDPLDGEGLPAASSPGEIYEGDKVKVPDSSEKSSSPRTSVTKAACEVHREEVKSRSGTSNSNQGIAAATSTETGYPYSSSRTMKRAQKFFASYPHARRRRHISVLTTSRQSSVVQNEQPIQGEDDTIMTANIDIRLSVHNTTDKRSSVCKEQEQYSQGADTRNMHTDSILAWDSFDYEEQSDEQLFPRDVLFPFDLMVEEKPIAADLFGEHDDDPGSLTMTYTPVASPVRSKVGMLPPILRGSVVPDHSISSCESLEGEQLEIEPPIRRTPFKIFSQKRKIEEIGSNSCSSTYNSALYIRATTEDMAAQLGKAAQVLPLLMQLRSDAVKDALLQQSNGILKIRGGHSVPHYEKYVYDHVRNRARALQQQNGPMYVPRNLPTLM